MKLTKLILMLSSEHNCSGALRSHHLSMSPTWALMRRHCANRRETDLAYGGYAEPSDNVDRLCGYMEAMAADVKKLLKLEEEKMNVQD